MKVFRALCFALALVVCCAPVARGEGFALNEWSARGVSLAGGLVGRADDVSTARARLDEADARNPNHPGLTLMRARLAMGEKLRRLPLGFYQRHDAGDIDSVLLRDYETVENYGAEVLSQAGMIAAKTTLSAVVLAFFDWRLALATFAVVPCALPFLWKGFNAMAQSSGRLTKASQECSSRTIEYVAGIRTLKAFNLAGTRFDSLRASFEELRKASLGKEEASRPVGVFGRALLLAGAGVVMLAGCALLQAQAVHPFVLLMFLLLALGIYEPIVTLFYFLSDFGNADAAGKRIERLLAEPELPEPPAEAPAAPHGHGIAFDDVSFSYGGDERALEHVSLTIPEGGLTALVGPSGSGKSTVAKLAARFWDPQAGTVTLGGADLARSRSPATKLTPRPGRRASAIAVSSPNAPLSNRRVAP